MKTKGGGLGEKRSTTGGSRLRSARGWRWDGLTARSLVLSAVMAVATIGAVALALNAFSEYRNTVSSLAQEKTEGLMAANLLQQQAESLVASGAMLLLANSQLQRREAMFEIQDRVEWIDRLTAGLYSFHPSERQIADIQRNRDRLRENLDTLDRLVAERISLWEHIRNDDIPSPDTLRQLGTVESKLAGVLQENRRISRHLEVAVAYHVALIRDEMRQTVRTLNADIVRQERWLMISATVVVVALMLVVGFVQYSVVGRLTRMQRAMHLPRPKPQDIVIRGRDEIAGMGLAVRRYVERITANERRITRMNEELEFHATRDALTGLHNRRHFEHTVDDLFDRADAVPLCLAMIDVDHFKQVNDNHGHDTGDRVLIHIAAEMRHRLPESMYLARYGGEEFAVLATGLSPEHTHAMLERLREHIAAHPLHVGDDTVRLTISVGIAPRFPGGDAARTLKAADESLYAAKRAGRNRIVMRALRADDQETTPR